MTGPSPVMTRRWCEGLGRVPDAAAEAGNTIMSATPDFTKVPFDAPDGAATQAPSPAAPTGRPMPHAESAHAEESSHAEESWLTAEGIAVKERYGAADRDGLDFVASFPGLPPYLRGPYPTMYVTQPWTIRQYAGFSTAEDFERLLPAQPRRRAEGAFGGLRSRHPPRL